MIRLWLVQNFLSDMLTVSQNTWKTTTPVGVYFVRFVEAICKLSVICFNALRFECWLMLSLLVNIHASGLNSNLKHKGKQFMELFQGQETEKGNARVKRQEQFQTLCDISGTLEGKIFCQNLVQEDSIVNWHKSTLLPSKLMLMWYWCCRMFMRSKVCILFGLLTILSYVFGCCN